MIEKLNDDMCSDMLVIVDKVNEIIDVINNSLKPKLAIVKFDGIPRSNMRLVMDHLKDIFQDCGYRAIAINHEVDISTDVDMLIIDGKPYSGEELRTIIKEYEEGKKS